MIIREALTAFLSFSALSSLLVEGFTSCQRMSSQPLQQTSSDETKSSSSNGIKGIIFDIDGTLADSWNLGYQATLTVLTDYHNENNEEQYTLGTYPLTAEEYHYGCRFTTPERLARHVGLQPGHESFESIGEQLGARFDDYYVQLVDTKTAGFYEGIGDMLVKLHCGNLAPATNNNGEKHSESCGIQLGALTNACVEYAHAVLKANCPEQSSDVSSSSQLKNASIYDRFSSIHGANSVPRPKPFGDGIQLCCEEMNLIPSDVIYVGDAPTDARAAVDAQCRAAIGVLWGSNDEECLKSEEGFDILCADVYQLERAIANYL